MNETVIETKKLVHTYPKGGVTALKGVDLQIFKNEKMSIIGQNGSGKTTIVRHFNGLLKPTSGSVFLFGEDTKEKTVGFMSRQCGYVFQNPNHQIFCTTVYEELEVAPKNFKFSESEIKQSIEEVVNLMDLENVLYKHPLTLDYTTKKIVTIATVLVFKPEILILDEPTGRLDEQGRIMLTKIIDMMHSNGHTVIMISHDMDYVAENSDRIVVMSEGEIIGDGTPKVIFVNSEISEKAQIEPPQISQLDMYISGINKENLTLSVSEFTKKYSMN